MARLELQARDDPPLRRGDDFHGCEKIGVDGARREFRSYEMFYVRLFYGYRGRCYRFRHVFSTLSWHESNMQKGTILRSRATRSPDRDELKNSESDALIRSCSHHHRLTVPQCLCNPSRAESAREKDGTSQRLREHAAGPVDGLFSSIQSLLLRAPGVTWGNRALHPALLENYKSSTESAP